MSVRSPGAAVRRKRRCRQAEEDFRFGPETTLCDDCRFVRTMYVAEVEERMFESVLDFW